MSISCDRHFDKSAQVFFHSKSPDRLYVVDHTLYVKMVRSRHAIATYKPILCDRDVYDLGPFFSLYVKLCDRLYTSILCDRKIKKPYTSNLCDRDS